MKTFPSVSYLEQFDAFCKHNIYSMLHDLFTIGFNGKTLAVCKLLATSVIIQECFKTFHELQLLLFLRQLAFK